MKIRLDDAVGIATIAAEYSNMRQRLGAVLYDKRNYVVGFNRSYDVEVEESGSPFSLHAEEMCVIKGLRAEIDFPSSTLVVVRVNRQGELRMSKPCHICQKLIEKVGIRRTWYVE